VRVVKRKEAEDASGVGIGYWVLGIGYWVLGIGCLK
jgi:hypothetical protein